MLDQTILRTFGKLLIGNMPVKCMRKRALSLKELLDIAIEMTDLQHGKRCGIK